MTMIHRRLFRPAAEEYDDGDVVTGPNTRKRSRNILLHSARSAIHIIRKLGEFKNYMKTKWLAPNSVFRFVAIALSLTIG